jgi:hypothetical protein
LGQTGKRMKKSLLQAKCSLSSHSLATLPVRARAMLLAMAEGTRDRYGALGMLLQVV